MERRADNLAFPAIVGTYSKYSSSRKLWDDRYHNAHLDRLETVKPVVDNKPPRTYLHCHVNMKKMQMEQKRQMDIERDNRLLASRIAMPRNVRKTSNHYQPKPSMNADIRNRELVRISLENQAILMKINLRKPVYDHKMYQKDFKITQEYMSRLQNNPPNTGAIKRV
ncbi:sperm axonemal maintenance protein CFAP97D1-like [Xyrauchen texanus]|uniref:sperm axonemal maintenance protein CFAP97D1-like n=1 Tax=Xyrauchen texanus TaxID=154827 RepID=UPI002242087E|nr:sperm axonemal maintenance protein CFAP97D1-like [Xyrauchen texanus]